MHTCVRVVADLVWVGDLSKCPSAVCIQIIFNDKVVSPGFQQNGIVVSRVGVKMYVTIQEIGVQVMFSGLIFSVEVPFNLFANNTEGQCGKLHSGCCLGIRSSLPMGLRVSGCAHMWFTSTCSMVVSLYTGHSSAAQLADPHLACRHLHQ